jgi:hypothetical protein
MNDDMNALKTSTAGEPGEAVDRIALVVVKVLGVLAGLGLLAYLALCYLLSRFANWQFVY